MAASTKHPLNALRRRYPAGLSIEQMQEILERDYEDPISKATIRKYVQLGLMERSTRRGLATGHGSKGYYPVTALVQLVRTREHYRKYGQASTMARGSMEVHRHLDAIRESLENALSALIVLSRQERRSAGIKPDLVRLRGVVSDALDELGGIAQAGSEEEVAC